MTIDPIFAPKNLHSLLVATGIPVPDPPAPRHKLRLDVLPDVVNLVPGKPGAELSPLIIPTHDAGFLALTDKPSPHALLELMLIHAGSITKSGIDEFTAGERQTFFVTLEQFINFVTMQETIAEFGLHGSLPRISYNFDPHTDDRTGLQLVKRLHAHLYLLERDVLECIQRQARSYHHLDNSYCRRRIVDPLTFLGAYLLYDLHQSRLIVPPYVRVCKPDAEHAITTGLPLGFNVFLDAGSTTLGEPRFHAYMHQLHCEMQKAADEIMLAFTDNHAPATIFTRHPLLPATEIQQRLKQLTWLSPQSLAGLQELACWLKSPPQRLLQTSTRRQWLANHHVVLNGLAYSIGIAPLRTLGSTTDTEPLCLTVAPRLFSSVGGAGLFACQGVGAVLLDRGRGTFTHTQMQHRHHFQRCFFAMLQRVPQGR